MPYRLRSENWQRTLGHAGAMMEPGSDSVGTVTAQGRQSPFSKEWCWVQRVFLTRPRYGQIRGLDRLRRGTAASNQQPVDRWVVIYRSRSSAAYTRPQSEYLFTAWNSRSESPRGALNTAVAQGHSVARVPVTFLLHRGLLSRAA